MNGDWIALDDNVSRRKALFGTAAFGGAFALAVQPVQADAILTPTTGLDCAVVDVSTADGKKMMAYRAMPASGTAFGTVIVVQEIFGVHVHIADMCRRFAKAGYYAIAPDLYFRQGDATKVTDMQKLIKDIVSKVTDQQVLSDLDSTVAFVKAEGKGDTNKLGITGFCWGGRFVWLYDAHNPAVKAGVAWYGKLVEGFAPGTTVNPIDVVDKLAGPVQGLYGGADQSIPQETVERMRAALKASKNPAANKSQIKVYADTPHAFNADYRPSYRKEAAEDGWKLCLAWFKANGVT